MLQNVSATITKFIDGKDPSIADLVLPYTAGVILDDLAQPPSYLSPSHQIMLNEGFKGIENQKVSPGTLMLQYPRLFEDVIMLSRVTCN